MWLSNSPSSSSANGQWALARSYGMIRSHSVCGKVRSFPLQLLIRTISGKSEAKKEIEIACLRAGVESWVHGGEKKGQAGKSSSYDKV